MKQLYVILFFLISYVSTAQKLLKDIVTSNASSHPRNMVNANGKHFFVARGINSNSELWVTDGTEAGTIQLTSSDSYNNSIILSGSTVYPLGGKVLFSAYNYLNGNYQPAELWISDGTVGGTTRVKDINPYGGSYPSYFFSLGNKYVFWANDGVNGTEPWITDGTESGTMSLGDLNPGANSSYPYSSTSFAVVNSKLFFSAISQYGGYEPYVTDGTPWGTYRLKDINNGSSSSSASNFIVLGNKVIFTANDGINGNEPWVSDGTEQGTFMLKDIYQGQYSSYTNSLIELNGKIIFRAESNVNGAELWISDGTSAGTKLLKDIAPGSSYGSPQDMIKVGNSIFFTASDGTNGRELWKTNGTTAGTVMVKDINLTSTGTDNFTFSNYNRPFLNVNGTLFFLANSGPEGFELWKSDGTANGTMLVKDFVPGPASAEYNNFQVLGSNIYFSVPDTDGKNVYYKSNGTSAGTVPISDANPNLPFENVYPLLAIGNSYFYFAAYNAAVGYELFKTDGTTTSLVKDIDMNQFNASSSFNYKAGLNNNLFFNYNDNLRGNEVWKTDGMNNTNIVKELRKYPNNFYDYYSTSTDVYGLFTLNDYTYYFSDYAIWRTNGSSPEIFATTNSSSVSVIRSNNKIRWAYSGQIFESDGESINLIKTLDDYSYSYGSNIVADLNGITFFTYSTNSNGNELWRTDGTAAGTWMLRDINWGPTHTGFGNFRKVGNKLFFTANEMNTGYELWVTNGTSEGTYMVKDVLPGSSSSYLHSFTNLNDNLLIFSTSNVYPQKLWRSDGTESGTYMVPDAYGGSTYPSSYESGEFGVLNNRVYYEAYTGNGYRLYSSDGNSTTQVHSEVDPEAMIKFKDQLFFRGAKYYGSEGYELWKTDGTASGTTLVKDIYPGYPSSRPSKFFVHNDNLYFLADDGIHGQELWALTPCADSLNLNSGLSGTNTYQASKVIVGETANNISSTANITYDAGKYVLLKPGFNTSEGAVFQTKLVGCGNSNQPQSNAPQEPKPLDEKTAMYIQDMQEAPSIENFIEKGDNQDLALIWAKYLEESRIATDKERQLQYEVNKLNEQQKDVKASNNQETLNNYYTSKAQKQQAYQEAKQEAGQYSYVIVPVRDAANKKLGYDLTIYAAGKMHQSAIRY
ncbi:3-coathanger stack domain-containing protein [Emticicia soli]|uniref:3-coathanger stack domain-containing protein n=1 Tax=Emticicia soli TaxID=2027878 RepID=A0ABW5J9Q4_9BACT